MGYVPPGPPRRVISPLIERDYGRTIPAQKFYWAREQDPHSPDCGPAHAGAWLGAPLIYVSAMDRSVGDATLCDAARRLRRRISKNFRSSRSR